MELEKASHGDEKILADMWFELAEQMEKYSRFNEITYETSQEAEEGFREQINGEEKSNYLIKEKGLTKGFITLKEGEHPSRKYEAYTQIINLYVKEKYRSEGLGTKALDKVKELARENGSDHLKVTSEIRNTEAVDFYKENGFGEKQVTLVQEIEEEE